MTRADEVSAISLGEIAVGRNRGRLRTLLGSCVGLALFDPRLKVAGLAHIVLPESRGGTQMPGKFADTAVPAVIRQLEVLARGERLRLAAKLAGGANMFDSLGWGKPIGEQNLAAVERLLELRKIAVLGRSVGGSHGRRMTLDVATGAVTIESVGKAIVVL